MTWLTSIKNFLESIWSAWLRFPLSLICSVLAAALLIYANHLGTIEPENSLGNTLIRLSLEAIAGIPMFYAFHIFSENKNLDIYKRIGLIILGLSLLGLHFYSVPNGTYHFENNYTIRYLTVLAAVHLIISFSLYYSKKEIDSFWHYNEFLFVRFITVILFSIVFYLGIIGAMWAAEKLLTTKISYKYYYDVFMIILIPFNTLFFFSGLPADSHHFEKERTYQNALRIFIQYILIPIIIIYGAILCLYVLKIIINGDAPSAAVAVPILIYSGVGILTYLLAYPIRDGKYFLVRVFCKYFYFILLPLLTLYFKALITTIWQYGFTENRYLSLAVGIWLVGICLYGIIKKEINIIWIPITLSLVLIFSTFGPWGMYDTSGYSQFYRLKKTMQQNNLLDNGKINSLKNVNKNLNKQSSESILSAIQYLYTHHQIHRIKPLLSNTDYIKLQELEKTGLTEGSARNLLGFNSEGLINVANNNTTTLTFTSNNMGLYGRALDVTPYKNIVQINAIAFDEDNVEINLESEIIKSVIVKNKLIIYKNKDTILRSSLDAFEKIILHSQQLQAKDSSIIKYAFDKMDLAERQYFLDKDALTISLPNAKLFIDELKLKKQQNSLEATQLNGIIAY